MSLLLVIWNRELLGGLTLSNQSDTLFTDWKNIDYADQYIV